MGFHAVQVRMCYYRRLQLLHARVLAIIILNKPLHFIERNHLILRMSAQPFASCRLDDWED